MKTFLESLLNIALPSLLLALAGGTAWVGVYLGAWLKTKAQNSRAFGVLDVVFNLALTVVQDIEANEKAAMVAKGGVFDGATLKKLALDRLKLLLGPEGLAALQKAVGAFLGGNLDTLLSGKVEQAVAQVGAAKTLQQGAAAASPG